MAVAAPLITVTDSDEAPTCKHGHAMSGANVLMEKSGADRVVRPRCRTCKNEAHRQWMRRSRGDESNPMSMLFPRSAHAVRNEYATATLFSLIPKDLRVRVAGVLMDDRVDPLQRRVLQRCADRRAWAGMDESSATRVFIERCIEQTIDARSPGLRIDRLLGLFLAP